MLTNKEGFRNFQMIYNRPSQKNVLRFFSFKGALKDARLAATKFCEVRGYRLCNVEQADVDILDLAQGTDD